MHFFNLYSTSLTDQTICDSWSFQNNMCLRKVLVTEKYSLPPQRVNLPVYRTVYTTNRLEDTLSPPVVDGERCAQDAPLRPPHQNRALILAPENLIPFLHHPGVGFRFGRGSGRSITLQVALYWTLNPFTNPSASTTIKVKEGLLCDEHGQYWILLSGSTNQPIGEIEQ